MKNQEIPMFTLRLGASKPDDVDVISIYRIREDLNVVGCEVDGNILSLFMTDKSIEELHDIYKDTANEFGVSVSVIIWKANQTESLFDIHKPNVKEAIKHFEQLNNISLSNEPKPVVELTVDEILDKISRAGIDSLTQEELTRLKNLG